MATKKKKATTETDVAVLDEAPVDNVLPFTQENTSDNAEENESTVNSWLDGNDTLDTDTVSDAGADPLDDMSFGDEPEIVSGVGYDKYLGEPEVDGSGNGVPADLVDSIPDLVDSEPQTTEVAPANVDVDAEKSTADLLAEAMNPESDVDIEVKENSKGQPYLEGARPIANKRLKLLGDTCRKLRDEHMQKGRDFVAAKDLLIAEMVEKGIDYYLLDDGYEVDLTNKKNVTIRKQKDRETTEDTL